MQVQVCLRFETLGFSLNSRWSQISVAQDLPDVGRIFPRVTVTDKPSEEANHRKKLLLDMCQSMLCPSA